MKLGIVFLTSTLYFLRTLPSYFFSEERASFRLPTSLEPINYKIQVMPILDLGVANFSRFTAPSKIWIDIRVLSSTNSIFLHVSELSIENNTIAVLDKESNQFLELYEIFYDPENDFIILTLRQHLNQHQVIQVQMEYVALISQERLNGIYLDYYETHDGVKRYVATTLFAPNHARKAFPCFDEPGFRSTYDITIGRSLEYKSLSNSDLWDTVPITNMEGWVWDVYERTPLMSSYIIAMIVCDFEFQEAELEEGRSIKVYATEDNIKRGAAGYGADLTRSVIDYFQTLFGVNYPMKKLFSIALPQFFFNAMENFGMITYKEPAILYLANETTEDERFRINYIVSHEVAHQWFGNIVSVQWWTYVWLKEGFATYFSYYAINETHPEFSPWERFIHDRQIAMDFDISSDTHPLENSPLTPQDVVNIYTPIPYQKGASILRMTSAFIGEHNFLTAIRLYLGNFKYREVEQNNLFSCFDTVMNLPENKRILPTGVSVKDVLDSWTKQSGYPLITVSVLNDSFISLTQEKFIGDDPGDSNSTWWVPINIIVSDKNTTGNYNTWMAANEQKIVYEANYTSFIIVNPGGIGYYVTRYDDELLDRIYTMLSLGADERSLPVITEFIDSFLLDYFNMALNDYETIYPVLKMGHLVLSDENVLLNGYEGVIATVNIWRKIDGILGQGTKSLHQKFQNYATNMLENAFGVLDSKGSNSSNQLAAKGRIIDYLCKMNSKLCEQLVKEYIFFPSEDRIEWSIPNEYQRALLCYSLKNDPTGNRIDYFFGHYLAKVESFSMQLTLMESVSCSTDEDRLRSISRQVLESPDRFPRNDAKRYFLALSRNQRSANIILELFDTSLDEISQRVGKKNLKKICRNIAQSASHTTLEQAKQLNSSDSLTEMFNFMMEVQAKNTKFLNTNMALIQKWLGATN